jgi:pimeloyl-ACP methyl ester carboxylesterase
MPYLKIDQASHLYYEINGDGDPIIFIHPPAMGLVTFKKQKPLAEKYKIITYDIRGNGLSSSSDEKITIPLLAADLKKLLDELQVEEAVLCCYSNAASIGLEFALTYPERVKALILSGGFPEVDSFLLAQQFHLGMLTARCKGIKLLAKVLAVSHTKEKEFQQELYKYILKVNPTILYDMYKEGLYYNCTNRLSQLTIPVMLVYGGKVDYIHKHYKIFESRMMNTDTIFIDKSRHQIPTKHYNEFNMIIDKFMRKLTKPSY